MRDSLEPDPRALQSLAAVTTLLVLGLLCFAARILSRIIPTYRINASDYVSAFAVIAVTIAYGLFVASIFKGFGRHSQSLTYEDIVAILRLSFFNRLFGTTGATLTRLSIALQLLPFSTLTAWKAGIWAIATLEAATFLALIFHTFLRVQPITKNWDGSGYDGGLVVAMYVFLGAAILGDLCCSIMPLFPIWDLSRSRLERCLLSVLIALSLCAAAAPIKIIVLLTRLENSSDAFRDSLIIYTWCLVENTILIVASCAPLLKSLVERALCRLGFQGFQNIPRELGDYPSSNVSHKFPSHITWMWHSRHGNTSQYQNNSGAPKDSRCGPKEASYITDTSMSDFSSSSARAAITRVEDI